MADDGIIRIGTSVDISNIQSGMAEAQDAVRTASENMVAAQEQFGKAAAEGNEQAAAALKLYEVELASAQAALAEFSETEEQETTVLRNTISARMAASAELRVLEGNLQGSTRAAASFLSTLPGIGVAMQAAFPIFGAVALVSVLGEAVGAVDRIIQAFHNLDGAEIKAADDAILAGEKIIKVKSEKFTADSFARAMSGEPGNPDSISLTSASVKLREVQYARELADAQAAVNEQGKTGVALQQQKIKDAQADIEYAKQAKAQADALAESYRRQAEEKITVTHLIPDSGGATYETQEYKITDPKQIQAIQSEMRKAEQAAEGFNHQIDMMQVKLQGAQIKLPSVEDKDSAKQAREAAEAARKAAEEEKRFQEATVQATRDALEEMKALHTVSATDEAAYWISVASSAQGGSLLYAKAMEEVSKSLARAQVETVSESKQIGEELTSSWLEATKTAKEATKSQNELAEAVATASEKMTTAQQDAATAMDEANLRTGEATGQISKLSAFQITAQIHAQAYREEIERLDAALTKLAADESLTPEQRTEQVGQLQAQKAQVQGQAAATGVADTSNITQQIAQPYMTAFNEINSGWLKVQNQMLFSTRNLGLAFAKMGQQIFISIVDNLERAALVALEKEVVMTLAHQAAVTTRVATDATGAAASTAISKAAGMEQGLQAAELAFKNTYAVVSQWPVVGPVLAPVLASAAFVAVAAFEDGTGYVPRDGMAYLHEGEAVVPAPTMNDLRSSSVSGGDVSITQNNHWNTMSDREFQRQLEKHASHVAGAVRKHMRQGGH